MAVGKGTRRWRASDWRGCSDIAMWCLKGKAEQAQFPRTDESPPDSSLIGTRPGRTNEKKKEGLKVYRDAAAGPPLRFRSLILKTSPLPIFIFSKKQKERITGNTCCDQDLSLLPCLLLLPLSLHRVEIRP